jgi:hypothetical protein
LLTFANFLKKNDCCEQNFIISRWLFTFFSLPSSYTSSSSSCSSSSSSSLKQQEFLDCIIKQPQSEFSIRRRNLESDYHR